MSDNYTLDLFSPAKLNLFLHITGKRDDGYHTLQSLLGFLNVGDTLKISPHDSLYIDVDGPFSIYLDDARKNLVYKAAQALAQYFKVPLRAKILLTKNLPIASGLGGGSSNAATALRGLMKLWDLPDDTDALVKIAGGLGADVTACLYNKLVWVEGIGEKMTRLSDLPDLHFVLANPMVETPTAEVFRRFHTRRFSTSIKYSGRRKSTAEWIADLKLYRNDLTDAALLVTPEIADVLAALAETPGCHIHRLSGSGATCFGLYTTAEAAAFAAQMVKERHPSWWTVATKLMG